MKKLYFFLALALAVIGISVSNALITTVIDQGYIPVDNISEGKNFVIGINISSYNGNPVTFFDNSNYDFLWDDNGSEDANENFMPMSRKTQTAIDGKYVWTLEAANADTDGQWYYIKNCETGRYWSYEVKDNCDPSDIASLPQEGEDEDIQWWKEGEFANCCFNVTLVADKANAQKFLFKKPSEGVQLIRPDVNDFSSLQHMFDALDDSRTMIIAKVTVAGKNFYTCANSAYGGGFSRYHDWAGYWALIETTVEDDPITELERYLDNMVEEYPVGIHPGCVEQTEEATAYNTTVAAIRDEMDNAASYDNEHWYARIEELKALETSAQNFTYRPVGEGFFRMQCLRGDKYALFNSNGNGACADLNLESKNQIWQVSEEDGKTYLRNVATHHYMPVIEGNSQNVVGTYEKNPTTFTCCNTLKNGEDKLPQSPFNINIGNYLHSQGTNMLTWWDNESAGDRWLIYAVTEEELTATFGEGFIQQVELEAELTTLLNEAESTLNESKVIGMQNLITNASQISSPKTETTEGNIANLIDNDYNTYWHSKWSEGDASADNSEHYLQFELSEAAQVVEMWYARRSDVKNDHPTHFEISACTTADGEYAVITDFPVATAEEEGEDGSVTTVESSGADKVTYHYNIDLGAEYKYLRVRATMTDNWRGYWHASEMTFYLSGGADLFAKTGEAGTALEEAIATAKALTEITADDVAALQAAYDAFLAAYTNPSALMNAIAEAREQLSTVEIGSSPGQTTQAAWDALNDAVTAAQAWLKNNLPTCTQDELSAELQTMLNALEAWYSQGVQTINTDTWYYISFPNERDLSQATPYCEAGTPLQGARVACGYADYSELDQFGGTRDGDAYINLVTTDMLSGTIDGFDYDDEMAQWRFVDAGDGTYAIQNRATGLFMQTRNTSSGHLNAHLMPGRYIINPLGNGTFEIGFVYSTDEEGEHMTYLNVERRGFVCTYFVGGTGDIASVWKLTAVEAIESGYVQMINVVNNGAALRGLTLPYALNIEDMEGDAQFFTEVQGIDDATLEVGLNETYNELAAGTPFFVYNIGNTEEADGLNVARVPMSSDVLSWNVDNSGVIVGSLTFDDNVVAGALEPGKVTDGDLTAGAFTPVKTNKTSTAGAAWLDIHNNPSVLGADIEGCDEVFVIDGNTGDVFDAIEVVKGENGKTTVIYNMNGQRVSANVKGLVIINGKKMLVK